MAEKKRIQKVEEVERIKFGRMNYLLLLFGVISIAIGYFTLSKGSITLAPILLVLGYCVFIPLGIVARGSKQ